MGVGYNGARVAFLLPLGLAFLLIFLQRHRAKATKVGGKTMRPFLQTYPATRLRRMELASRWIGPTSSVEVVHV